MNDRLQCIISILFLYKIIRGEGWSEKNMRILEGGGGGVGGKQNRKKVVK